MNIDYFTLGLIIAVGLGFLIFLLGMIVGWYLYHLNHKENLKVLNLWLGNSFKDWTDPEMDIYNDL